MFEVVLFALVVGFYGTGLRRDGLPVVPLCSAATATYWLVRIGAGVAFLAVARAVGRDPTFFSEATIAAAAPLAGLCAYAVTRLLERRTLDRLEEEERQGATRDMAAAAADPAQSTTDAPPPSGPQDDAPKDDAFPLLTPPPQPPRRRFSLREEWALAVGLIVAGLIYFGHTLATARPFWRADLSDPARQLLKQRASEIARLEARLTRCDGTPSDQDRESYRRVLSKLGQLGQLRVSSRRATPDQVIRSLDEERARRCGASSRPPAPPASDR